MFKNILIYALFISALTALAQDFRDEIRLNFQYYTDNNGATVIQPFIRATKTIKGRFSASFHGVVDAISAASRKYYFPIKNPDNQSLLNADAVTSASARETRREAGLKLSQKLDKATVSLGFKASGETDYQSTSVALGLSWALHQNSNLNLNYSRFGDAYSPRSGIISFIKEKEGRYQQAISGVANGGDKILNIFTIGGTQIFTPRTIGSVSWALILSEGFLESPYRQVLAEDTLSGPSGPNRGGVSYFESYPDTRSGNTFTLQLRQHYPGFIREGSVQLEYQAYFDNWGLSSHAGEVLINQYIFRHIFLQLGYRHYRQSDVIFYRDRYTLKNVNPGSPEFLSYMTADSKLSGLNSNFIRVKAVLALSNFLKPDLGATVALFPIRIHVGAERYLRSTHKDEDVRIRRYEFYDAEGLKAWILRGGMVFAY